VELKAKKRKHIDVYVLKDNNNGISGLQGIEYNVPNPGYKIRPPQIDFKLNETKFGDEYFLFDDIKGEPKYENAKDVWEKFIRWTIKRVVQMDAYEKGKKTYEQQIGRELVEYAKKRNAHKMYILMKRNWVEFRDAYLCVEDCPESVMEFVRGIMYKKMTEKQMWGSDEDRMPEGTVIIFDKNLMPKEGEDTGKLKFEYHPNYREEMLKKFGMGKGIGK